MDFSFSLYPETLQSFIRSAKRAEALGAASCLVDDSGMKFDPYVMLTMAARETSRLKLGTCTTNPISRHLGVTARAMATLNEVSNGRAILGIARGEGSLRPLGMTPVSPQKLGAATVLLRKLFEGESVDSKDDVFRFSKARLAFGIHKKIPVYVAATGPRMLRIAGAVGDGVIISVGADPRSIRYAIEEVRAGAKEAGRDPNSIRLLAFVFSSISESRDQALANAKPKALWFLLHASYLSNLLKIDDSQFKNKISELGKNQSLSDILLSRKGIAEEVVTSEIADAFTISGTKDECAEKVKRIADEGVDHIVWSIRENWDYAADAIANLIMLL